MNNAGVGREPDVGFVGEYRQEATPVPIPNTEVKLLPPMILLSGKVGHCRRLDPGRGNTAGVFLCADGFAGSGGHFRLQEIFVNVLKETSKEIHGEFSLRWFQGEHR